MSLRRILALALVAACSTLAACADAVTAPVRPTLVPRAAAALEAGGPKTCRGGWVSSAGRCE